MTGRFSLSFPGRRGHDDPWFRIGTVDVNTSLLTALLCVASMFVWALSPSLLDVLVLWPEKVLNGQIWRLVTWPIANEPNVWTVATCAMLWYFGSELERMVGRNRFAFMLLFLALVPGIFGVLLDIPSAGIRAVQIAIFCVFAAEFPNVRFFFAIPAWVFAVIIVGIEVLQLTGLRESERIILLFVTLATAALVGRAYGLLAQYEWLPRIPLGGAPSGGKKRSKRRKQSRDFDRVVSGPWAGPSVNDQTEMDHLLDKMNSVGLSDAERKRLTELGKRLRGGS